jgi:hypothetical protein
MKINNKETCACNNYDDKTLIAVLCIFINAMTRRTWLQQQWYISPRRAPIVCVLCVYRYYCCHRDERRTRKIDKVIN